MNRSKFSVEVQVKLALMAAISIVLLTLIKIPYPPLPFLVYDPADVPIYITSFAFGPVPGLIVTFIVCIIQAFVMGGDGLYGFLMHFIATGTVVMMIGMVYSRHKTRKVAAISLILGVILCTALMCVMNLIITPAYSGVSRDAVVAMLVPFIIPFNLLKAGINSLITFVVYKRLSGFLHHTNRRENAA